MLVLTERRGHTDSLTGAISQISGDSFHKPFVRHGNLTSRVRRETVARLDELPDDEPRCLVATGRLIGDGGIGRLDGEKQRKSSFFERQIFSNPAS